jgi:uncharacterized protein (TIGR02444 family)
MIAKKLPRNPFWDFSIKIYRHKIVEENLIALQDERGLNVNVLLFCFWYALTDQGRITREELRKLVISTQTWHERVVLPLRRIRRALKNFPVPPWTQIRSDIIKDELLSEQIEQQMMMDNHLYKSRPIRNNFQKIIDICKNVAVYCHLLNVFLDAEDCNKVSDILGAIFTKIDQQDIQRYCVEHLVDKDLQSTRLTAQFLLDL